MAVEWGWLTHRPAKIIRFKEDEGRIAYLTTEEAARLREAPKADANPQTYAFVVIRLETGMRRMEILSIRKEHVHLGSRMIYIPHAKAGARAQPITDNLAGFLRDYIASLPEDSPWLFPSTSKTGHTSDIRKAFRRAVSAAG